MSGSNLARGEEQPTLAQTLSGRFVESVASGLSLIALEEWTMTGAIESAIDLLRDRLDPNMADLDQAIPQWVFQRAKVRARPRTPRPRAAPLSSRLLSQRRRVRAPRRAAQRLARCFSPGARRRRPLSLPFLHPLAPAGGCVYVGIQGAPHNPAPPPPCALLCPLLLRS